MGADLQVLVVLLVWASFIAGTVGSALDRRERHATEKVGSIRNRDRFRRSSERRRWLRVQGKGGQHGRP